MASLFKQLDSQLEEILAGWSIYTTLLLVGIGAYLVYPLLFYVEPDVHPLLLARQSSASRVRQPGETAVYRAQETPPGYPLRSGLNVKDPGQPKWTAGRDGDLRDVWRRACSGQPEAKDGQSTGQVGMIKTVHGKEEVVDHTFERLSKEVNAIGKHLQSHGSTRVAIYLSNSVELLVALMAASFHNLTPILIPQEQPIDRLCNILHETKADALILGAGSVPLKTLVKQYQGLKQVVWVVPPSSRHVDWNEVSEGEGGKVDISTWHDAIDEAGSSASSELPASERGSQASNVILVSETTAKEDDCEVVEFTQRNLVSAIAAQLAALPRAHRISSNDILLSLAPLTKIYPLILTLSALYSNSTIALTSVTGPQANYTSAFHGVSPSIIVADPITLYTYEGKRLSLLKNGFFAAQRHRRLVGRLAKGIMAPSSNPPLGEGCPRLIYSWDICRPEALCNFRVFTGARVIMALTDPHVAGAISQTNMLDYRQIDHLGPPLSSVEVKLIEAAGRDIDGEEPQGKLVVTGPAVVGGETVIDNAIVKITENATLAYGEGLANKRDLPVPDIEEHIEHALANPVAA